MSKQFDVKKALEHMFKTIRECSAIVLWLSFFIEVFITDIGDMLVASHPDLQFVFDYFLLITLSSMAISWLVIGNKRFMGTFGYILFYPLIIFIWKFPKLAFNKWAIAIAFLPAIHQFISTFKANFVIAVFVVTTATVVCVVSDDSLFLPAAVFSIGFHLITHFYKKFKSAYSAKTIFTVIKDNVSKHIEIYEEHLAKNKPDESQDPEEYKKKLGTSLLHIYIFTTLLHLSIVKVREVIGSNKMDLYFLCSLLWTFILSVFSFGVMYYGLFRIDSNNFINVDTAGFWDFIGFSFSTLMTSSISTISPATSIVQVLTYAQLFVSLLLIVLLAFIILTSIREKYKKDLDNLLLRLEAAHDKSRNYVQANFELTADALESLLIEKDEQIMKLLLGFKYGKQTAESMLKEHKKSDGINDDIENAEYHRVNE